MTVVLNTVTIFGVLSPMMFGLALVHYIICVSSTNWQLPGGELALISCAVLGASGSMPTSLISVDPVSNIIAIKDILYATSVSVVLTILLIAVLVFSKYNLAVNHGYLLSTIKSSAKRIGKTEDVLLRVSGGALLFAFAVIAPTFFQLAPCNSIQCEAGQMLLGQRSSAYGIIVAATIVTSVAIYGMTRLLVLLAVSLCYKP